MQFNPAILHPEERIRNYCRQNICGSFNSNYMCPPFIGPLEEIKIQLLKYQTGFMVQYSKPIDVTHDLKGIEKTKKEFHEIILKLEKYVIQYKVTNVKGLIGGNCQLCKKCNATRNKPCRHPDEARSSLESLGIDVIDLLKKLRLESEFRKNQITWTGCILC